MKVGDVITRSRTFTREDIELFTRISGDRGRQHLQEDAKGRLMAHGLLTATLGTEVGGSLNFIAREMHFEFIRPVFSDDTITCNVVVASLEPHDDKWRKLACNFSMTNQIGKEVLKGRVSGNLPREGA